jgi:hypothetical protein
MLCGAGMAVLATMAGGRLGVAELARFGPVWWETGGAAVAWTAVAAIPTAVCLQALLRHGRRAGGEQGSNTLELRSKTAEPTPKIVEPRPKTDVEQTPKTAPEKPRSRGRFRRSSASGKRWFGIRKGSGREDGAPKAPGVRTPSLPYDQGDTYGALRDQEEAGFGPYDFLPAEPSPQPPPQWPGDATRESRWAALKDAADAPQAPHAGDVPDVPDVP